MRRVLVIAWSEWRAFYLAPAGWIVPAIFLAGSGLVFMQSVFHSGRPAELAAVLGFDALFLMVCAPAVTMASICQERRRGTLELLQASPAGPTCIVLGKWLGCMAVLAVLLVPTLVQVALLEAYGRPDLGAIATGYLGLLLLCSGLVATGLAVSAVVASQAVAFLVTCLAWIAVAVLAEVALPTVLGPSWHALLVEVDPLQRLQDFTLGLLDSANVVYFLSIIVAFLVAASLLLQTDGRLRTAATGWIALVVGLLALNVLLLSPELRVRLDATKSRAYSLSPRTQALLADLPGEWRLTVAVADDRTELAMRRQIDEVLGRFEAAAPSLQASRIDPTQPDQLMAWEALLLDLDRGSEDDITAWVHAIDQGRTAFVSLIELATAAAGPWRAVEQEGDHPLRTIAAAMAVLASQGDQVLAAIDDSMATGPHQPLPDLDAARTIAHQALASWSVELDAASRLVSPFDDVLPLRISSEACESLAGRLAVDADRLSRLEPLPRASFGRRLAQGEVAVVSGPMGTHVIPASQIVPRSFAASEDGRITFDQRFRGEQIISAAIRSLLDQQQPRVVFVHDGDTSVLGGGNKQFDVAGAAAMLQASRVVVDQWTPHRQQVPPSWDGGPTAWVVLPPMHRSGAESAASEAAVRRATERLIAQGEGVLISLFPSPAPSMGQPDPWATLLAKLGIEAQTGVVLLRDVPGGKAPEAAVELTDFPAPHPLASAMHGQSLLLPLPVPVQAAAGSAAVDLASVAPSVDRWIEDQWRPLVSVDPRLRRRPPTFDPNTVPQNPVNLVTAVETPAGGRVLVVGSGGWLRTSVADATLSAGGDRVSLAHPGNHELMMAATSWLSGLDDRIARGALSQEVGRLSGISASARQRWGWILLGGIPAFAVLVGVGVWLRRRS